MTQTAQGRPFFPPGENKDIDSCVGRIDGPMTSIAWNGLWTQFLCQEALHFKCGRCNCRGAFNAKSSPLIEPRLGVIWSAYCVTRGIALARPSKSSGPDGTESGGTSIPLLANLCWRYSGIIQIKVGATWGFHFSVFKFFLVENNKRTRK